jgi:hypothetical protein
LLSSSSRVAAATASLALSASPRAVATSPRRPSSAYCNSDASTRWPSGGAEWQAPNNRIEHDIAGTVSFIFASPGNGNGLP